MKKKYKIITLCGSTRFKQDFLRVQEKLTMTGNVVIVPNIFFHADHKLISLSDRILLDDIQRQKIDIADEIFIINKYGYIGDSTQNEIHYATVCGKTIRYMEGKRK